MVGGGGGGLTEFDHYVNIIIILGRGKYRDCILPGKVYKGAYGPGLYVAHDGDEHLIKDYEMLVTTKPMVWVSEHDGKDTFSN